MLSQLKISNFGLIRDLTINFESSLNILTGETGAGKSILIEALRIALGDKISRSQVRDPSCDCVIEAVFDLEKEFINHIADDNPEIKELFEDIFNEGENVIIARRTFSSDGKNKVKINGLSVTIGQLRKVGDILMDFHGPHDHQMLLSSNCHILFLDRLTEFGKEKTEYKEIFRKYSDIKKQIEEISSMAASRERELDLLSHQIKELEQVSLDEDSYEDIVQKRAKVNNSEKLSESIREALEFVEGGTSGTSESIRKAFSPIRSLNQTDETTEKFMSILERLQETNDEIIAELKSYAEGLSFDPDEAQVINQKFDIYDDIKRKYGPSLSDAKVFYSEAKKKFDILSNLEENSSDLRQEKEKTEKYLLKQASIISEKRKKAGKSLKKIIEQELKELGILNVLFDVKIENIEPSSDGFDKVTFFISPNAGEEMKPLAEIVSSGEAARVMLALKKALIQVDPIPTLIFDEIDAQIGGRLGTITGKKLLEISKKRQVILITHLPQIASFANVHYKVEKDVENGRAITKVKFLKGKERVDEIAQMMSGKDGSKISIQHANEMLEKAKSS